MRQVIQGRQGRRAVLVCVLCALAWAGSTTSVSATVQIKPSIGKPVVRPFTFLPAASGASVLAPTAHGGATVRFGAFQLASVAFTVQRPLPGRRRGKRCVKPTARNGKAKRCTRYAPVGRFGYVSDVPLGVVTFRFSGRVGGHKLKPGSYRLQGVPKSLNGVTGAPAFAAFNIA